MSYTDPGPILDLGTAAAVAEYVAESEYAGGFSDPADLAPALLFGDVCRYTVLTTGRCDMTTVAVLLDRVN